MFFRVNTEKTIHSTLPGILVDSLSSSWLHFLATDKYATNLPTATPTRLGFQLFLLACYPPSLLGASKLLTHSLPEEKRILETMLLYPFPFAQASKRTVWWRRRLMTSRKWQRDSGSRNQGFSLPGQDALSIVASNFCT